MLLWSDVLWITELAEVALFLLMYSVYHAVFVWRYRTTPDHVGLSINLAERRLWVRKTLDPTVNETIGVQAVRNAIMAGTFFSTSSLLVAYGSISDLLSDSGEPGSHLTPLHIKALSLSAVFFAAFFFFAFSVRSFSHLSFLVNSRAWLPIPSPPPRSSPVSPSPSSSDNDNDNDDLAHQPPTPQYWTTPQLLGESTQFLPSEHEMLMLGRPRTEEQALHSNFQIMKRATIAWFLGMRCFYTVLPLGLWLLGFPGLLVGTVITIVLFTVNDFL